MTDIISTNRPSSIVLRKKLGTVAPDVNDFDAVINIVSNMDIVRNLVYNDYSYTIDTTDTIAVADDITFELETPTVVNDKIIEMRFRLTTEEHDISHLKKFIRECRKNYELMRDNKLGSDLYYFDQVNVNMKNQNTSHLVFTQTRFETDRSFDNIYFEGKETLKKRVDLFLNNPKWYSKRGIPHTLGIITHGEPGCGKTSTNKAIAKMSKRHVINVKLSDIGTKTQLKNLFQNPMLHVYNPNNNQIETYNVPIDRRYFQIEDIDCMGNIVWRRDLQIEETKKKAKEANQSKEEAGTNQKEDEKQNDDIHELLMQGMKLEQKEMKREEEKEIEADRITLDDLLNIFDGTLEIPGRMLSITTNHIEIIDPALIRPGRIDMVIEFHPCNIDIAHQMFEGFYERQFDKALFLSMVNHKVSQAKLNQIMFNNMDTPEEAIKELITESKKRGLYNKDEKKTRKPTAQTKQTMINS